MFRGMMLSKVIAASSLLSIMLLACSGNVKPITQPAPPSGDSVRALLGVMHLDAVVTQFVQQMGVSARVAMARLVRQQAMNPEQRRLFDELETNMVGVIEYSWDRMGPVMFHTIQAAYTQQDVDAMLSFFKSPAGREVVAQLPLTVQALTPETMGIWIENSQSREKPGIVETLDKELAAHLSSSARDALAGFSSTASGKDIMTRVPDFEKRFDVQLARLRADATKRMQAAGDEYEARMRAVGAVK
jgi:uncharacterized protein